MRPTKGEADAIAEVTGHYREQINKTPALLSVLYDLDLMPEQILRYGNARRMAVICEMFEKLSPLSIHELFGEKDAA